MRSNKKKFDILQKKYKLDKNMYLIHISADLINLYLIVQKQYDNYITIFFYLFLLTIISNREIIPDYYNHISSIYLFITFYFFTQFLLESSETF